MSESSGAAGIGRHVVRLVVRIVEIATRVVAGASGGRFRHSIRPVIVELHFVAAVGRVHGGRQVLIAAAS